MPIDYYVEFEKIPSENLGGKARHKSNIFEESIEFAGGKRLERAVTK